MSNIAKRVIAPQSQRIYARQPTSSKTWPSYCFDQKRKPP